MAEGLLKKFLKDAGISGVDVRSCGTNAINGLPPTDDTIEAMKKEAIDVSGYRSKRANELLIKKSDLILAMSASHVEEILRVSPYAEGRTHLIKEFGLKDKKKTSLNDREISDPIGRSAEFYDTIRDLLKQEIVRIGNMLWKKS
jgi:protein-tyrosine phosphatase